MVKNKQKVAPEQKTGPVQKRPSSQKPAANGSKPVTPAEKAECYSRLLAMDDALYAIGGRWKLKTITALLNEKMRFTQLQRAVSGISAKVLAHELKELELNGFVSRTVYGTRPVTIEYELTPYSHTLREVVDALSRWGKMHGKMIREKSRQGNE